MLMDATLQGCPAARVIAACGGVKRTAELVGRHPTAVNRWMMPKEKGGTGGTVPAKAAEKLMAIAKEMGLKIEGADFF